MDPKELQKENEKLLNCKTENNIESNITQNDTFENLEDDELDDSELFDSDETSEEYGTSGEKYGWYNGFSDDAIDDAFEGDPENTWNVDFQFKMICNIYSWIAIICFKTYLVCVFLFKQKYPDEIFPCSC